MQTLQQPRCAAPAAAASAKPARTAPAAHGPACSCCRGAFRLRAAAPLGASVALPRGAGRRSLSVAAAAAAAEAPAYSVVNQKGAGMLPPSAGDAAPVWQAIIEVGGGQQIVSTGRFYSCHSLPGAEPGQKVVFERVLATKDAASQLAIGTPYVVGARVHATVLEQYKDKKIIVFKMKAKKHYRKRQGHRQAMTRFLVTAVDYA